MRQSDAAGKELDALRGTLFKIWRTRVKSSFYTWLYSQTFNQEDGHYVLYQGKFTISYANINIDKYPASLL